METIAALVACGADVNAAFARRHSETPLHWAASSNDVGAIDVLLDHGAIIEARGSVIGGGTPMSDAVAFGQWQAARQLVQRGAHTTLWQAAALGLMERVNEYFKAVPPPTPDEITNAFWCACHGDQRAAAEYLLDFRCSTSSVPDYTPTAPISVNLDSYLYLWPNVSRSGKSTSTHPRVKANGNGPGSVVR